MGIDPYEVLVQLSLNLIFEAIRNGPGFANLQEGIFFQIQLRFLLLELSQTYCILKERIANLLNAAFDVGNFQGNNLAPIKPDLLENSSTQQI